jgi:hypothetical protein
MRQEADSEHRRGVMAHPRAWIQSLWEERKTSAGQCCLAVLGVAVLIAVAVAPGNGLIVPLGIFGVGLIVAFWLRYSMLADEKLMAARNVLLDIAFQDCLCKSAPKGFEGCCIVCRARGVLDERFPGAMEELMEERLDALQFEESYIPEDLAASYITPGALAYLRERRLDRVGPKRFAPLSFTVRKLRK